MPAAIARLALSRVTLALLALWLLASTGCGVSTPDPHSSDPLLHGARSPIPADQLQRVSTLARRFASAYAGSIYLPNPPVLPGATRRVEDELHAAARRVPPARRGLDARATSLRLEPDSATHLSAAITVSDGRSPPFSVGFFLERRAFGWRVTSISAPG